MLAKQFRSGLKFTVSVLFLYLVMLALPAPGQESRSNIVGRVTDSSGAVVPNATVTATNQGTNVAVHAVSNGDGNYQVLSLNPGIYRITTAMTGFKTFEREHRIARRRSDRSGHCAGNG